MGEIQSEDMEVYGTFSDSPAPKQTHRRLLLVGVALLAGAALIAAVALTSSAAQYQMLHGNLYDDLMGFHSPDLSPAHAQVMVSKDPVTGKRVFSRVWASSHKAKKMELQQSQAQVHDGPDPAGSISSWDWSKNEGGGHFHDRSEDTTIGGESPATDRFGNDQAGNERGFTQTDDSDKYFERGRETVARASIQSSLATSAG